MGKLAQLFRIYTFASIASLFAGLAGVYVWSALVGQRADQPWPIVAAVWLLFVGLPSLVGASIALLDQLGVNLEWPRRQVAPTGKPLARLKPGQPRSIPVNGRLVTLGHNAPAIPALSAPAKDHAITVQDVEIEAGERVITQDRIAHFLRTGWARQRRGEWGMSRTWWVEQTGQFEREEYEILVDTLVAHGIIQGRKPGYSGKLALPPGIALHQLEQHLSG